MMLEGPASVMSLKTRPDGHQAPFVKTASTHSSCCSDPDFCREKLSSSAAIIINPIKKNSSLLSHFSNLISKIRSNLFISQCVNWVHNGGFPGRVKAKKDTNDPGKHKRDKDDFQIDNGVYLCEVVEEIGNEE